jgi:hypothetical protein
MIVNDILDVEGSSCGILSDIILAFTWRDWGKSQKSQDSQPLGPK